eukprot:m.445717 g.445717  ORF g.445717 m.445717 type:complete len:69 (+) comp21497_c0_seq5:1819-2025(+)
MYYNLTISTSPVAYGGNVLNGVIFCSDGDCQDNCVHLVPNCTAADCMVVQWGYIRTSVVSVLQMLRIL